MHSLLKRVVAFLLPAALFPFSDLFAAIPVKKHRAAFTAFAYANPPFWIAKDLKLFEKYGLDVELVYVAGARNIQALISGSIDFSQAGGASVVSAAAQGAEVIILGTVFKRLIFAVHVAPQIKEVSDLRGKSIAAGSVGGNSYFAGQLFLSRVGSEQGCDLPRSRWNSGSLISPAARAGTGRSHVAAQYQHRRPHGIPADF
jgi:ABC-type nitrate/sulfonate/bicarbonate transport system substrate-binding protein